MAESSPLPSSSPDRHWICIGHDNTKNGHTYERQRGQGLINCKTLAGGSTKRIHRCVAAARKAQAGCRHAFLIPDRHCIIPYGDSWSILNSTLGHIVWYLDNFFPRLAQYVLYWLDSIDTAQLSGACGRLTVPWDAPACWSRRERASRYCNTIYRSLSRRSP